MAKGTAHIKVKVDKDHLKGLMGEIIYDTLHRYSEWLDTYGLIIAPTSTDTRTNDDLVRSFLTED